MNLIFTYVYSSTVVLYDINTQKQDFIINTARKAITSLSLSPDGRYLATGEVNQSFLLYKNNHFIYIFSVDMILKYAFGI
jgi:WD40 repeat protein